MTLNQLRYVIMIAKTGNITQAARKLFISQPSLTKALRELEEEMGVSIFIRSNRGVVLTRKGEEFLGYARQVVEQADLMEERYLKHERSNPIFSVSCQHYSFAVNAFADVIKYFDAKAYDFTIRETTTHEIIEDVAGFKSEIGILYLSRENRSVLEKILKENSLEFRTLFTAEPHVFISKDHPLVEKESITIEELRDYPYLTFEQGEYNSFFFSEELLNPIEVEKNIKVRDRATLFNLAVGLNGYTVSSGIIGSDVNRENIVARKLKMDEHMQVGVITRRGIKLSEYALKYLETLEGYISEI